MELLDRYLQAVRFWLPKAHQNDIIEELRDDLRSQIEEKESSLGRAITEDELCAILQHAGNPMRIAARYQKQQTLISSELFPLYKFVLMIVILGYLVPWLVTWLARVAWVIFAPASYRPTHALMVISGWGSAFTTLMFIFGIVTLMFAIMERVQSNLFRLDKWDPRKLPRLPTPSKRKVVSRTESIFGLIFSIFFVVWWLSLPRFGYQVLGHGLDSDAITWNPALRVYFLPILLPTIVVMAQQCINIFRPQWTWLKPALLLVSDIIAFVVIQAVVHHYPYLVISRAAQDAHYAQVEYAVNQAFLWGMVCFLIGIGIAIIIHGFQAIKAIRRLRNDRSTLPVQVSQVL
ncbi:MAG TPA: hypothetical protein VKH81_18555 [Candidatus Angelobacter sp.]|nr:hypothetical protein [Candidatus Angelobacter sp.]